MAPVVTMSQLLDAGVHFGHRTQRWNPKMRRYIYGEEKGVYIIDLRQTLQALEDAYIFARDMAKRGGIILFVGTKPSIRENVAVFADKCNMPYVNERWLGGTITNFATISKQVDKLRDYQAMQDAGDFEKMPKKEALIYGREMTRLKRNLGGIRYMKSEPDAVFVLDTLKEHLAITEAKKKRISTIAVVDTNCNPDEVEYAIPGNDDAIRSGELMCRVICDAVIAGRQAASAEGHINQQAEPEAAKSQEPQAQVELPAPQDSPQPLEAEEKESESKPESAVEPQESE